MDIQNDKFFDDSYTQLEGQRGIGAEGTVGYFDALPSNKRVFEVGFGKGVLAKELIEKNNSYYGIDVGKASSIGAEEEGFIDKGTFLWLDGCQSRYPFLDNFFSQSFCTEVIEHLENPYHMFKEVKRTLKHNGIFIIAFPRPEDNFGVESGNHYHMYPGFLLKHSFRYFLKTMYFEILKYKENGSSAWYRLRNIKEGIEMIPTHTLIQGNYEEERAFGQLNNVWTEELDPKYEEKQLHKFKLKVK